MPGPVRLLLVVLLATAAPGVASAATPRVPSLVSDGVAASFSYPVAVAEGGRSFFTSAEPLVPADQGANSLDVYRRDVDGSIALVTDGAAASSGTGVVIDRFGEHAWFETDRQVLPAVDADAAGDIYERTSFGGLRLVTPGTAAAPDFAGNSDDGTLVVFGTYESLDPVGDGDAAYDLYGSTVDGVVLLTPGSAADVFLHRVAADGSRILVDTASALVPADTDPAGDLYLIPTGGGDPVLVTPIDGVVDRDRASVDLDHVWFAIGGAVYRWSGGPSPVLASAAASLRGIAPDGTRGFLETALPLDPDDDDGTGDIYEVAIDGPARLATPGTATPPTLVTATADGALLVRTAEALDPADQDGADDLYGFDPDGTRRLLTGAVGPLGGGTITWVSPFAAPRALVTVSFDVPALGDTNGAQDVYEFGDGTFRPVIAGTTGTGGPARVTPDGAHALVTTYASFDPADVDGGLDVYRASIDLPRLDGLPRIVGDGRVGTPLSCSLPDIAVELATAATLVWRRDGVDLAFGPEYVPVAADAGRDVRCRVVLYNVAGSTTADSAPRRIAPLAAAGALGGVPVVGTRLRCTTFAGAERVSYRWLRDGRVLARERSRSYRLRRGDAGRRLRCRATATSGPATTVASLARRIPARCVVPRLRGRTRADAVRTLGARGCRVRSVRVTGGGVVRGRVVGTSPVAGARLPNGATVTVRLRR